MAFYVAGSGTQTVVLNTEHTVFYTTTAGVYLYALDTKNLVGGDIVTLRLRTRLISGGTDAVSYYAMYAHTQTSALQFSIPLPVAVSVSATIQQTAGTARAYDYSVYNL